MPKLHLSQMSILRSCRPWHLTCRSLRYPAESNCCTRFCRPLPNHSARVPYHIGIAKLLKNPFTPNFNAVSITMYLLNRTIQLRFPWSRYFLIGYINAPYHQSQPQNSEIGNTLPKNKMNQNQRKQRRKIS
jgi:hypothetical protein